LDIPNVYQYRVNMKDLLNNPPNSMHAVHIIRDPRSVITSIHPSSPGKYLIDFQSWSENNKDFMKVKSLVKVHTIRYEELLLSPERVQQSLSRFLGITPTLRFSEFLQLEQPPSEGMRGHVMLSKEMGGVRPLDVRRVHRWKEPEAHHRVYQQLQEFPCLTESLIELGYEADSAWAETYLGRKDEHV
jgi:hypothetical protein